MTETKRTRMLILFCCVIYFVSYITRHNYAAALAEIVQDMQITKAQGSYAVTGMFITYGLGQLVSGWLGDRFPPRWVIFGGVLATALCNLGMAFLHQISSMTVLWCINGVAQAMLWPPLVRIMAENLGDADYKRASVLVSIAASCGSITVYLIVPACIWLSGWRLSFLLPAGIALLAAGIWIICEPRYEKRMRPQLQREKSSGKSGISLWQVILISGLPPIMLAIVLQGMLRDGITTWMPTYITENYHLQTGSSILTTVLLPVFSIISISVASWLQKKVKSDLTASTILFTVAFGSGIVLLLLGQIHAVISILCMTLITGCMHGINMLLISRLPAYFQRFGKVSTISGILNTFTYVGSAASAYGFAALSEQLGWQFTVGLWGVIAGLGALTCFLSIRHWNRFVQQGTEEQ